MVSGSHRNAHPRVRRRFESRILRRKLQRVRSRPETPAWCRCRSAASHQVSQLNPCLSCDKHGNHMKEIAAVIAIAVLLFASACQSSTGEPEAARAEASAPPARPQPSPSPSPAFPDLQSELLDDRHKTTTSPLASFDFKNFTYPLPRGWQNPDGSDLTLTDGRRVPVSKFIDED